MELRFLGRDTGGGGCPTLWATDHGTFLIQGWRIMNLAELEKLGITASETVIEVPKSLMRHLPRERVGTSMAHSTDLIWRDDFVALHETNRGTFVICGWRVTDVDGLASLDVPDHETVIEVPGTLIDHLPKKELGAVAPTDQDWTELFRTVRREAFHLEMRDQYGVGDEAAMFADFRRGRQWRREIEEEHRAPWLDLMRETIGRGVRVRRARIVSEPVTEYIAFEYAGTHLNAEAGEEVRWLSRRLASGLALPGNDLWLFDGERVQFNLFTGDGDWAGQDLTDDPGVVELCRNAIEAVWLAATPHEDFTLS